MRSVICTVSLEFLTGLNIPRTIKELFVLAGLYPPNREIAESMLSVARVEFVQQAEQFFRNEYPKEADRIISELEGKYYAHNIHDNPACFDF